MQTGEFALPTPPAFPALARGEALRDIPTPPFVPALTLGEAVSEAIREAAYEIGAYGPADAGETGVGTKSVWRIAAGLARELWKRGARLLE